MSELFNDMDNKDRLTRTIVMEQGDGYISLYSVLGKHKRLPAGYEVRWDNISVWLVIDGEKRAIVPLSGRKVIGVMPDNCEAKIFIQ